MIILETQLLMQALILDFKNIQNMFWFNCFKKKLFDINNSTLIIS